MKRIVAAVLASLVVGCVGPPPDRLAPLASPDASPFELVEPAATTVTRRALEVTVRVRSLGCEQFGLGSGFVLPDGLVVTNRHVIDRPVEVSVSTWDGRSFDAEVAGVTPDSDLAILRLSDPEGLPVAELRADPVVAGESVHVVGYPGGGPAAVTSGEVLATVDGTLLGEPADVIRVDAEIRTGNSGGPLLDADGRVVGIVFAVESSRDTGLVVPVETLMERLDLDRLEDPAGC